MRKFATNMPGIFLEYLPWHTEPTRYPITAPTLFIFNINIERILIALDEPTNIEFSLLLVH